MTSNEKQHGKNQHHSNSSKFTQANGGGGKIGDETRYKFSVFVFNVKSPESLNNT